MRRCLLIGDQPPLELGCQYVKEPPYDLVVIGSLTLAQLLCFREEPVLEALEASGEDFRILLMPDHYTLLSTQTHDGTPVPYAIYDSRKPGTPSRLDEATAAQGEWLPEGRFIMGRLLEVNA